MSGQPFRMSFPGASLPHNSKGWRVAAVPKGRDAMLQSSAQGAQAMLQSAPQEVKAVLQTVPAEVKAVLQSVPQEIKAVLQSMRRAIVLCSSSSAKQEACTQTQIARSIWMNSLPR